jgi:hypothetical protein
MDWKDYEYIPKSPAKLCFDMLGGDTMPVGGFGGPFSLDPTLPDAKPIVDFLDEKYFQLLKEAGINTFLATLKYWGKDTAEVQRTLDLCEKYRIACFVLCGVYDGPVRAGQECRVTKKLVRQAVEPFIRHPACVGIYLRDEPFAEEIKALAKIHNVFSGCGYGDKTMVVNFAGHALPNRKYYYNYQMELMDWIMHAKPKVVCMDHYPADGRQDAKVFGYPQFMKALSVTYNAARIAEIPFWSFGAAGGQWGGTELRAYKDTIPLTEGEFRWPISLALAYGAKGIMWFPMIQPRVYAASKDGEDFERNGVLGADGRKTPYYAGVAEMNAHIRAVEKVLINAVNACVIPVGAETKEWTKDFPEVLHVPEYEELTHCKADNALIGCFKYMGKTALYAVNTSRDKTGDMTMCFGGANRYRITVKTETIETVGETVVVNLGAGEGALVVVEK